MEELPFPSTRDQRYLAAVCDRLDTTNALLATVVDRLTAGPATPGGQGAADADGAAVLEEPAVSPAPAGTSKPAVLTGDGPPAPATASPKRPAKTAKKATAPARRRTP